MTDSDMKEAASNFFSKKSIFSGDWIRSTKWYSKGEQKCMNDHYPFEGHIYTAPIGYKDGKFKALGVFCSLECAYGYMCSHVCMPDDYNLLFSLMLNEVYGINEPVVPATGVMSLWEPGVDIESWRALHKAGYRVDMKKESIIPFVFENHKMWIHPASQDPARKRIVEESMNS